MQVEHYVIHYMRLAQFLGWFNVTGIETFGRILKVFCGTDCASFDWEEIRKIIVIPGNVMIKNICKHPFEARTIMIECGAPNIRAEDEIPFYPPMVINNP